MRMCDSCRWYDKTIDENNQYFNDVIKIGDDKERHYCPCYFNGIPQEIYYNNATCDRYDKK